MPAWSKPRQVLAFENQISSSSSFADLKGATNSSQFYEFTKKENNETWIFFVFIALYDVVI